MTSARILQLREQAQRHEACGSRVYLDFDQCETFGGSYHDESEIGVAASTLLASKDYDEKHIELLRPLGSSTLLLEHGYGEPPGWFTITAVFPA
jgi:hypothetical protein